MKLSDFDSFLDRLEQPLPEAKTARVIDMAMNAQAACAGFGVSCAQFTVSAAMESVTSILQRK
jgi:uncharacterized protein (DUF1778 family)